MGNALQEPPKTNLGKQSQEQQEEALNFTCEICTETMLSSRKFRNGSLCTHPFCSDCVTKYIEFKVKDMITGYIECPELSCKHQLDPVSCRPFISKPVFDKWCDRLCESAVLESESFYCPYPDCSALVLNEARNKPQKVRCPKCKKFFCFICKIPWHAGYRCNESEHLRDRNDILLGELIEKKRWTRCFNCGYSVERVSGCRVIKCRCGVRFCHGCGAANHSGVCNIQGRYVHDLDVLVPILVSFCLFLCSLGVLFYTL